MRQLSESKFLLTSGAHKLPEVKYQVKLRKLEIKLAQNICFYLEILLGAPSCMHVTLSVPIQTGAFGSYSVEFFVIQKNNNGFFDIT